MMQVARNLTDEFSGCLVGKSHLIVDRDTKYTVQFRRLIAESRTAVIRLPPRSPNLNAYAERFVRSIKEECLDRMIFVGQGALRRAITEFVAPLSHGAQSPRRREPIAPARRRTADAESTGTTPSATRWNAELLLWSGCVDIRRSIWTIRVRRVLSSRPRLDTITRRETDPLRETRGVLAYDSAEGGERVTGIREWLQEVGLEKYAALFAENEITLEVLPHLTEADIGELCLPTGSRRRLMVAIQALGTAAHAQPSAPSRGTPPEQSTTTHDAERRQLTVMFCDLVGSTALAQKLDPEELRDLMEVYQSTCRDVIARYDGHVAQYLGDGLMVYFGWPRAHEDDPARAIRAGLEVTQAVSQLTASTPTRARVGIHTGVVVVGETGHGDASVPKAAVGDTPNIAARLQGFAEPGTVVTSSRTRGLARGLFDYADLGAQLLKGIAEPMPVFRVVRARVVESRFDASRSEVALTPLVGREEELALLVARWNQARAGEGQVVLVGGEPGIGKSRLVQALRNQITNEPHTALRYQCSPYHLNSPLYPIVEQFQFAAGFTREDTQEQKLDKMEASLTGGEGQRGESAPLVAALLSLPIGRYPPRALSPQKLKEKTLEALAAQIEGWSQRQPLLITFEDVHWIDPTSQELLDALVVRLRTLPILLVITYRPEYAAHWGKQAHVTLVNVDRLRRQQGAELVANLTAGKALPDDVLDQILSHTDGVPLFVEELTKSVLESKLLKEAGDHYVLEVPLTALGIPATLRDSLIARLDRLAPVREVAQIGACIGREFSYELLAALSPIKGKRLEEALGQLTNAGLLFKRDMRDAVYTFKHALVQDAAYDSLLKSKRAQLHAQIAKLLEKDFCDQVENAPQVLAHHYTQAGNLTAAIPLWRKAGELALARVALQEALGHFQKGLALIEQRPPSVERDGFELSIREPLTATWIGLRGTPAAEVGVNAAAILRLATKQREPHSVLLGLWGMWASVCTRGRVAESLEWAERLVAEGDNAEDIDLQIVGHGTVMMTHLWLGHLLEAREHGNQALALYDPQRAGRFRQITGYDLRTVVAANSAQWTWMLGYPDQAVQVSDDKDTHARRLGDAMNLGFALCYGAYVFDYRREPKRLLECVNEADRLAREQSIPFLHQVVVPQVEGIARLRNGQLAESISLLRRSIDNQNRLGGHSRVPYAKSAWAEALALQGDLETALRLIDEALEQIERPGWQEQSHLAEILRLKGWMLKRQGRGEEAEAQLRASIDRARQQQAKSWELRSSTTLAELLVERGQRDAARELLAPIYNWFTEGFDTHDLKAAREMLESFR